MANELWKIRAINEHNKKNRKYCKHNIDDLTECTHCLAESDLLLENKDEVKRFKPDHEILGEKYYGETKV